MELESKVQRALAVIRQMLAHSRNPAFMCSFGKDSMVLLDILTASGIRLPVIFHRQPGDAEKYRFAEEIAREWLLEVYDYAPSGVTLAEADGNVNIVYHYQIGPAPQSYLSLPKNVEPGVRCGLDILRQPTGSFNYPWDAVIIGHKSSDTDNVAGSLELHTDVKQNGGIAPDAWFPLRNWTDADIWEYTRLHGVPQQLDRYNGQNHGESSDKSGNSDYVSACVACMNRSNKNPCVYCPKLGLEVSNISHQVPYTDTKSTYFGKN
jgi:hypothetical protein